LNDALKLDQSVFAIRMNARAEQELGMGKREVCDIFVACNELGAFHVGVAILPVHAVEREQNDTIHLTFVDPLQHDALETFIERRSVRVSEAGHHPFSMMRMTRFIFPGGHM